ncbi:DUF2628 domain-containing protein [Ancylobacter lacus]|uniref:DUF2628 domain-containing protein n=1 Tax=Ancylobacter lacus TaxID=2579970 RepID=UPI001BCB3E7E|nr:DUF2628 domain-containing protein [Ancylobacter lacus]MBS7537593.1 DUF2628 domain-containing protein [Ancylobacter lacus]
MAVWTVFQPEDEKPARALASWSDRVVFVREGFAWSAFFFSPLVLLWHRLWLGLLGYAVAEAALAVVVPMFLDGMAAVLLHLIPNLLAGLLLADLRRLKLERLGYEEVGAVVAPALAAAERRFLEGALAGGLVPVPATGTRPAAPFVAPAHGRAALVPVLGLFPEADRR